MMNRLRDFLTWGRMNIEATTLTAWAIVVALVCALAALTVEWSRVTPAR